MNAEESITKESIASAADWALLRKSTPEDFDGHTGFDRMSPTERLRWLEDAAAFVSRQAAAVKRRVGDGDGNRQA